LVDILLESVNLLSVLGVAALVVLTAKPFRTSGVPYLVAVPAGFGLMTVAFSIQFLQPLFLPGPTALASTGEAVSTLIGTYGTLFIAFAYAKRTRVRVLGESTTFDLLVAALVTLIFLGAVFLTTANGVAGSALNGEILLRAIMVGAFAYLVYETFRNWTLTQKASQGIVTVGFAFFIIEQMGFILATANLGSVALFLAYEGRIMGLFVLIVILTVGIKKEDPIMVMKRLGLVAPVHSRAQELLLK